jgi:hypothetical protein
VLDPRGAEIAVVDLQAVDPADPVELNQTISVAERADRVSVHLSDQQGVDRGRLGEAKIVKPEKTS